MSAQLIILDFGSQYTQLIARTVRELGVYCEILPGNLEGKKILEKSPKAFILSGSPFSVYEDGAPLVSSDVFASGLPIFGICYGMQLTSHALGGGVVPWELPVDELEVDRGGAMKSGRLESMATKGQAIKSREYGPALVTVHSAVGPFARFVQQESLSVWMSHGDKVSSLPSGFEVLASSDGAPIAAFGDIKRNIYGVQFHPEVHHTPRGKEIIASFLFDTAHLQPDWDSSSFIAQTVAAIKDKASKGNVVCGLSGGVDSTVAATLVHRAIGNRLHCIFVDNGLLREGEAHEVMSMMSRLGLNVTMVDAGARFLAELAGVTDPEKKRKIIGRVFIEVFEAEAHRINDVAYLVQGTLYPDVIESISVVGHSQTIKSHHNVGGLVENMKLGLIEPLRELFKDEVRAIGRDLDIPEDLLMRQPFPGPGLAVRCLGELVPARLEVLRRADRILREEIKAAGIEREIWQSFAVLLPVRSVGVMGDGRTFDETIAIRAVTSRDGMTADWYMFPEAILRRISTRIVNETKGVNRVVLDISTKPPATIEWE